eukprot:1519457-Karenia_brevis.AAC.1
MAEPKLIIRLARRTSGRRTVLKLVTGTVTDTRSEQILDGSFVSRAIQLSAKGSQTNACMKQPNTDQMEPRMQ